MTMNDAKFEIEVTHQFKIYMRTNFDWGTQKSQKLVLYWAAFDQSIQCLSLESIKE